MKDNNYKYKVCINCHTYNQSKYICDALNGFTMQTTDFPFIIMLVDDASTDGEKNIISNYVSENFIMDYSLCKETDYAMIQYAKHKTNFNCHIVVHYLKYNHYQIKKAKDPYLSEWRNVSKYEALCEGDDYWIHPRKLQIQVDFLEKHHDYVLCHTDFNLTSGKPRNHYAYKTDDDNFFPYSIYHDLGIGTLTTLYRKEAFDKIPQLWKGQGWPMGDMPLWIELSHEGKFKRMPIVTANYRILSNSASHGDLKKEIRFLEAIREVKLFYANYYGLKLANEGYTSTHYAEMIKVAFKHKNEEVAKMYKKEAVAKKLTSFRMWFYYYAIMIRPLGYVIRNLKGK